MWIQFLVIRIVLLNLKRLAFCFYLIFYSLVIQATEANQKSFQPLNKTFNKSLKNKKINAFQVQIKKCLQPNTETTALDLQFNQQSIKDEFNYSELFSVQDLYKEISKKYLLITSEVQEREVDYKIKNEDRKLKFRNSKVILYKVDRTDDNESLIKLDNGLRQGSLTIEAYLTQLLLAADIRYDWQKIFEKRTNSTEITLILENGVLKIFEVFKDKLRKKLKCKTENNSDSCSCVSLN